MIVDSNALEEFLNNELKSRCEADPTSLTRYVMALLKKKRKEKELRLTLLEALDVFLGKETISFVEMLMEALKSESYISKNPPGSATTEVTDNFNPEIDLMKKLKHPPPLNETREKKGDLSPKENERKERRNPAESATKGSSNPPHIVSPPTNERVRPLCKAYEELGYCLAGNACSYFHGVDALVVDDVRVCDIFPPTRAVMAPHGEIIPPLPPFPLPPLPPEPPVVYPSDPHPVPEYNPEHPAISHTAQSPSHTYELTRKRELVILPLPTHTNIAKERPPKRKAFDYNRLGPKPPKVSKSETPQHTSNTIELKNVPPSLNTICNLNALFAKFGTIVNIEIGAPSSVVRFMKPTEAESAFRNMQTKFFDILYQGELRERSKDRGCVGLNTVFTHESKKNHSTHTQPMNFSKLKGKPRVFSKLKNNQKEKNPALVKKKLELLRKKQCLLSERIANYKMLVEKMSTKNNKREYEEILKETLDRLGKEIISMKNEITTESSELKKCLCVDQGKKPTYMHSEKDLLDAEMDYYHSKSLLHPSKISEASNKDLLSEVNELKEKAKWLGLYEKEPSGESPGPEENSNEILEKNSLSEGNLAAISVQEEQQCSDISKSDSILLGDDEEEDEEEDSEARSWRR